SVRRCPTFNTLFPYTTLFRSRQLHLNAFLRNVGQHEAAWRRPETDLSGFTDIGHYIHLARTAERGLLDAIFFADHPVLKSRAQRSEEHTSELQSRENLVCRLL